MNKILLTLFLLTSQSALIVCGQEIKSLIDLRGEPDNPKYYIGFGVRTNTATGHSFVILGRENSNTRACEIELPSFYPANDGWPLDDGRIIQEFQSMNYVSDYNHLIFIVDERDYANAKVAVDDAQLNPSLYNIISSNCADLVATVIGRIGIKVPSTTLRTPFKHLRNTVDQLNNGGLQYKRDGLLRTENSGQTTVILEDFNNPESSVARTTGFGGFMYGKFTNGKFDGAVLNDNGNALGKLIFYYNQGQVDFSRTEIIDEGTMIANGRLFTNYNTPLIESYADGSKRTIEIDVRTGNKVSSIFETVNWTCNEYYTSDFTFYQDCNSVDGKTAKGDMQIIVEDNVLKVVPKTDRFEWTTAHFTFKGSSYYRDKKIYSNGRFIFSNGDTYEGQLENWKFNGSGRYEHRESCTSFLGIRFGNCNSFINIGTWSNGNFEGHTTQPVNPQQGVVNAGEFTIDLPAPNTNATSTKPATDPAPSPTPSAVTPDPPVAPTPLPSASNSSTPNTTPTNPRPRRQPSPREDAIPRVDLLNVIFFQDTGFWILP